MSNTILTVEDLRAGYGGVPVLHGLTLRLDRAEIVTVIGPNGAGKSTLLNTLAGILPAASGRVALGGRDLSGVSTEARLRAGLCLVPEKRELFPTMPVADNLLLGGYARRREGRAALRRSLDEVYGTFPRLAERRRQLAGTLSGGERQMLAMGRALMSRPSLLLLDEPSLGLAPLIVAEIFRIVSALRAGGTTILLVEQNARAALAVADRAIVLELGRITLEGPASAIARDPRITSAYLGGGVPEIAA